MSSKLSANITDGTSIYKKQTNWNTLNEDIVYKYFNGLLEISGNSYGNTTISANQYTLLGTLPNTVQPPSYDIDVPLTYKGGEMIGFVRIGTDRSIKAYSNNNTTYWAFYFIG